MARRIVIILGLCVILPLVVPFRRMIAPAWDITVVPTGGLPIANVAVRVVANDYSCGGIAQEETRETDASGQVHFPPRYKWTSLLRCGIGMASSATAGVHASFGRYTYVFALTQGNESVVDVRGHQYEWTGEPAALRSTIVLHSAR